jgi:biofilm PGA synthesis lipoprotein PgaB
MLRRVGHVPSRSFSSRVLLLLARVGLAIVVAIGIAVPVVSYLHTRQQVLLGDRAAVPKVRLAADDLAEYRQFAASGPAAFVVLRYDDLSTHPKASSDRVTRTVGVGAFAAQLAMLKAAGFVSVSADQVAAHVRTGATLPRHAVLITFDQARQRDWNLADPVLAHYGYSALVNVDPELISSGRTSYLSWTQLTSMADSGRWSLGLDVSGAGARLPFDSQGDSGPAVLEHAWVAGGTGPAAETTAQYQARIREGLQGELDTMAAHGLARPQLLAYPFQPRYPLARAQTTFGELAAVVNSLMAAGALTMTPDTPVTEAYRAERLLPALQVYGNTTTHGLFSRIEAATS